ncbi:AraC family transcriptional regulator [Thalassotalea sp. PLHSN55]|uniref:AraC family transcriptional regulator n=1 Tax=Thalassotalea sp. PLHSN55 TaxID=3435888 RepID=UPI003F84EE47
MKAVLEHITKDVRQSFHYANFEHYQFNSPWHYHPQWELTYIKKGTGIAYIGNTIRNFCAGELVLVGRNLPHCWRSEANKQVSDELGVASTFIQWDEHLLGENWLQKPEFESIANLLDRSHQGILFSAKASNALVKQLENLKRLSSFERLWQFIEILQALSQIDAEKISHEAEFEINHQASKRIENLIAFVEQNYQNSITADDLAKITHLTPSSFSKFFKKVFNKTFTTYLNEYRISQACILLRNSDKAVEDIAFLCGYNNMAFFHRRFKKQMKTSPAVYRRQLALISTSELKGS